MPDDIERLLDESMQAITDANTRRGVRCMCGCGVTFMTARAYFRHAHPSSPRGR